MKPHLYIVTGTSRGLGEAIARRLLVAGNTLVCLSRTTSATLAEAARAAGVDAPQWSIDLADATAAAQRLGAWLDAQPAGRHASATLINNAALLPTAAPLQQLGEAELSAALRVGLEAPLQLMRVFLRATQGWGVPRRVLNISSGLARQAMGGQAAYCAVKAGLDHATRAIAIDEARAAGGAKLVSLAPGVIETGMQAQLRGSDPQAFPDAAKFRGLYEGGQLATPDTAAARVLAYLARADFGANPTADVREA